MVIFDAMYQRDYILRMIRMMAELIAAILDRIRGRDYQQAAGMIQNAYYDFLKQDAAFFHSIPEEELTRKLLLEHHYSHGHLEILAELFYAEAELLHATGDISGCLACYGKSKLLLEFLLAESGIYSIEKEDRIIKLEQLISTISLN